MAYADQGMSTNRIIGLIVAAVVHVALGYALVTGLAYEAVKKAVERVTTVDIEEPPPPEEEPPPPEEVPDTPPPPVAPPPPINIAPAPPPIQTQPTIPPPAPIVLEVAPPPAPPSQARGVSPKGQRRWQRRIIDNYPSRALRQEVEGRVGVRVTVGSNGRISNCTVSSPSGSSVLDRAACADLTRYGRFEPALDDAGNPTSGSWRTTIVYQLN